jgi:hypothetical protein
VRGFVVVHPSSKPFIIAAMSPTSHYLRTYIRCSKKVDAVRDVIFYLNKSNS